MATKTAAVRTAATRTKTTAMNMAATTKQKKSVQRIPAPTKRALDTFVEPSKTDVNGSYTGRPENKRDLPVQDADDL